MSILDDTGDAYQHEHLLCGTGTEKSRFYPSNCFRKIPLTTNHEVVEDGHFIDSSLPQVDPKFTLALQDDDAKLA